VGFVHQHISLKERMEVGIAAAVGRGTYGLVTGLARELGTSRKFIYDLAERARGATQEAMRPTPPGPKPPSRTLVVDRRGLDRAIVTLGMVGKVSERGIADCLGEIYGCEPSVGYVSGVLERASRAAGSLLDSLHLEMAGAQVEADELFARNRAHLVALEHSSMVILLLKQADRCDESAWRDGLADIRARGVEIGRLGSDGGKALGAAASKVEGVEHQLDRFHALRQVGRVARALERAAYKAIAKEEGLARKAGKMNPAHPMGGYVHDRAREVRGQTEAEIGRYDAMRILKGWVAEALEAIEERSGRLRSRAECLADLGAATALMRELGTDAVKKLADYLDEAGPGLLAYADQLVLPMARLARDLGTEGMRMLAREWVLAKRLRHSARAEARRAYLKARLICLLHYREDYDGASRRVFDLLDGTMRGSSLAECVNSLLRPYAQIMRGLGDRFLPLFQFYRNAHVFERGKRAGSSPFQLAGINTPEGDWLDQLGLGRQAPPLSPIRLPSSVRSLPIAA
jgi:hypothetical protein